MCSPKSVLGIISVGIMEHWKRGGAGRVRRYSEGKIIGILRKERLVHRWEICVGSMGSAMQLKYSWKAKCGGVIVSDV